MPPFPLAHILAPQIMARARDIEAELGPPTRAGYLAQQSVGEKTPYDPRGLVDKPAEKTYNGKTPGGAILTQMGILQRSNDFGKKIAKAWLANVTGKTVGKEGTYFAPKAGETSDPHGKAPGGSMLVPMPNRSEPIGFTESGEAIYAAPPAATPPGNPRPMKLKKGEAAGYNESGETVDPKGKKLGYLVSPSAPMGTVSGPGRELPMRDLARRKTDAAMDKRDSFGAGSLQMLYGPHLKAWQDNFQDTGKEEFPTDYFKGMPPTKRKMIEEGVKALRDMERGTPT